MIQGLMCSLAGYHRFECPSYLPHLCTSTTLHEEYQPTSHLQISIFHGFTDIKKGDYLLTKKLQPFLQLVIIINSHNLSICSCFRHILTQEKTKCPPAPAPLSEHKILNSFPFSLPCVPPFPFPFLFLFLLQPSFSSS